MSRSQSVILVSAVALLGPAFVTSAAPVPRERSKGPAYFPTRVGAKWVYDTGGLEVVEVVTKVERAGGERIVSVGQEMNGKITPSDRTSVSEKGLYLLEAQHGVKFDPPLCLLKLPLKPGEGWEVHTSFPRGQRELEGTETAYGPERVEVPAGAFQAIRVESDRTLNGVPTKFTTWYVLDVGLVKSVFGQQVKVLKSFTPGREWPPIEE